MFIIRTIEIIWVLLWGNANDSSVQELNYLHSSKNNDYPYEYKKVTLDFCHVSD